MKEEENKMSELVYNERIGATNKNIKNKKMEW